MKKLEKLIYTGVWFIIDIILLISIIFIVCEDNSIDWLEGIYFGLVFLSSTIQGYNFYHAYHKND